MSTWTTEDREEAEKIMNNEPSRKAEPVAWMFQGAFDISTYVSFEKPNPDIYPNPTPLYTHPAKTLTDEEILKTHAENPFKDGYLNNNLIEFAKAILRKAQEK